MMLDHPRPTRGRTPLALVRRLALRLSGHDEISLLWVPDDWTRAYAAAWAMIGTSCFAIVGMTSMLARTTDLPLPVKVALAIGWGIFVLGLDYSLVAVLDHDRALREARALAPDATPADLKAARSRQGRRGRVLVRLLFAVVLGAAVGESLLLTIFDDTATRALQARDRDELEARLCEVEVDLADIDPQVEPNADCTAQNVAADPAAEAQQVDTATLQAEVDRLVAEETATLRLVQCESQPRGFSAEERARIGCSGVGGDGPGLRAANARLESIRTDLAAARTALEEAQAANSAALDALTSEEAAARQQAAGTEAVAVLREERASLIARINGVDDARATYDLNERFQAVENEVDPWIKWGTRGLFILADTAVVLLTLSWGSGRSEMITAIGSHVGLLAHLTKLREAEELYRATAAPTLGLRAGWVDVIDVDSTTLEPKLAAGPEPGSLAGPSTSIPSGPRPSAPAGPPRPSAGAEMWSDAGLLRGVGWRLRAQLGAPPTDDRPGVFLADPIGPDGEVIASEDLAVLKVAHVDESRAARMLSKEHSVYDVLGQADHVAELIDARPVASGGAGVWLFVALRHYAAGDVWTFLRSDTWITLPPTLRCEGAAAMVDQILSGLDHACRRGVLSLDLKASNMFIDGYENPNGAPCPHIRLGDWGLGKVLLAGDPVNETRLRWVSELWHSPEWVFGDTAEKVATTSDLYSVGVLLYLALTGVRPYEHEFTALPEAEGSDRYAELLGRVRTGEIELTPPEVPEPYQALAALAMRWLSVDPAERQPGAAIAPGPRCDIYERARADLAAALRPSTPMEHVR